MLKVWLLWRLHILACVISMENQISVQFFCTKLNFKIRKKKTILHRTQLSIGFTDKRGLSSTNALKIYFMEMGHKLANWSGSRG